jgi:hypothetical protein
MQLREEEKEVEDGSWTCCKIKRSHGASWSSSWRPAARVEATGDGGATWRGGEKARRGRASGGRAIWRARWCGQYGEGQLAVREMAGEGQRAVQQSNREEGERGRRRGLVHNFSKVQGLHCKVRFSFKP